jgi:DNA mismatch repair protein MutS2
MRAMVGASAVALLQSSAFAMPSAPRSPHAARFFASGLDLELVRSLFERLARTSLGARAVRELAPRTDDDARAALRRTAELVSLAAAGEVPAFGGVTDLRPIHAALLEFHRPLDRDELAALSMFLSAARRLCAWFGERATAAPECAKQSVGFPELARLRRELESAVDERGELVDTASPRLAKLRREVRELDDHITELVAKLCNDPDLRPHLADFKVHRRAGRRVLALKARNSPRIPGVVHERSQSGETVYVEPREAVYHSNRLVEVESAMRAEEARILGELSRHFVESWEPLSEASARLAEWELAHVGQLYCARYGARVPDVATFDPARPHVRGLVLRGARHPLLAEQALEGTLAEVVPIDVRLGGDFDLLVITGPNTGGKTLALKTVGIAAFSLRLGWPFPCGEGSRVPLYDGIVADIGDEQEIRQSLSTFASHLERIRAGLEQASGRTLFLLDELGGGTDPAEGAALGEALLEHLLALGAPTVATTHLGKLKEFCFSHERAENASVEFDPISLRPRFRLLVGTPGESNALAIAERRGLSRKIVARARERLERRDRDTTELLAKLRGASEHAESVRRAAEARLEDAERSARAAAEREAELARRGELVEAEAQRGLEERVRDARRVLDEARALAAQVPGDKAKALREALERTEMALTRASLTERRKAFLEALDKGQMVYIPRYRQRCQVRKVDRAARKLTVKLGGMDLAVTFDEVTWYESL